MLTDLILAILHHLLVFTLAALLAVELAKVRPGLKLQDLRVLGAVDGAYGAVALAIVVVGLLRVVYGLRGWEYYVANHSFWAKMLAFLVVGLLSIRPTMRIVGWGREARRTGADYVVPPADIAAVRRTLWLEAAVFALIPVFAAMMARGVG